MWHHLSLRTRILLGYGAGLVIMAALVALLLVRLEQINDQIRSLNATSAAEAEVGAQLASRAALVQQAVNRFLQQPQAQNRQQAAQVLDAFKSEITRQRGMLTSAQQQARIDDLALQIAAYDDTFRTLDGLLNDQITYRFDTTRWILQSSALTNRFIYAELSKQSTDRLNTLITTQSNLQSAAAATSRMVAEQNPQLVDLALASLRLAKERLQGLEIASTNELSLHDAALSTTSAMSATQQLAENLTAMHTIRSTRLVERSDALQGSADAIARGALAALTQATAELEQQLRDTEQAAVIALLAALAATVLMGLRLSRALTKPLDDLVVATGRINQGDYEQPVAERAGGEIGRLVAAFNQMTATLRQQRVEVVNQQSAVAERNRELEQTLERLQAATTERAALVSTIQALSVPVIPILDRVIVVPLVGELDGARAQLLLARLLDGVVAQRARMAILDITGVAMIDAAGARWLLQAASAVELLGARVILAGTRPEVAQALVASGADLSHLRAAIDLRAAIEYVSRRMT